MAAIDGSIMKDFKIPGFLWVVLIAVAVMLAENYLPSPLYVELALLLLFGIAKAYNLGTQDIEDVLDILRRTDSLVPRGRSIVTTEVIAEQYKPNKTARWLVG